MNVCSEKCFKSLCMDLVFMLNDILISDIGKSLLPSQQAVSQWKLSGGVSELVLSRAYLKFFANAKQPLESLKFCLEFLDFPDNEDVWYWHKYLITRELKSIHHAA